MAITGNVQVYPGVALERGVATPMFTVAGDPQPAGASGSGTEWGISPTFATQQAADKLAFQSWVTGTGAFSVVSVQIQGSLDGIHWVTLLTLSATGGEMQFVALEKMRYVRANVVTLTAGSGAPLYNLVVLY